ncbi:MAG: hypothetical protein R3C19_08170 [Planctomycetaceae bacterium]
MTSRKIRDHVFQQCRDHILAAVNDCEVADDPFPHFMIRGFFPEDVYADILQRLPERRQYAGFSYSSGNPDAEGVRWRFDLSDQATEALDTDAREFWLGIRDALGCVALKEAVFGKLCRGLAYRYSVSDCQAAALPGYPLPALFREEVGYRIKPHPDTRKKMVTMQIALPADDSQCDIGTQFYRRSLNPRSLTREPRGFEVAKTAPFVPNAAYAFVVLNTLRCKSWHGRTTLAESHGVRNTILNIWHEKPAHGHSDVVREHYSDAEFCKKAA